MRGEKTNKRSKRRRRGIGVDCEWCRSGVWGVLEWSVGGVEVDVGGFDRIGGVVVYACTHTL